MFFFDGSKGGTATGTAYRILKEDTTAATVNGTTWENNTIIDDLKCTGGSITGCTLATDNNGNAVKSQAVAYMKAILGIQGVQTLLEKTKRNKETIQDIENQKEDIHEEEAMAEYEEIKNTGQQMSNETALDVSEEDALPYEESTVEIPEDFIDPVEAVKQAGSLPLLQLVLPEGAQVSGAAVSTENLLSQRSKEQGIGTLAYDTDCNTLTSEALFNEYIFRHFPNYCTVSDSPGLRYQMEYILYGKNTDADNLEAAASRLLAIREASNLVYLFGSDTKRAEAKVVALILGTLFGAPQSAETLVPALLVCWAFAESVLDIRNLLRSGKVPLYKDDSSWQLSLSSLPKIFGGLDAFIKSSDNGLSYQDYLRVLFLTSDSKQKLNRVMDLIEYNIRQTDDHENFRLDCCIYALETEMNFTTAHRIQFTAARSYGYNMQ